MRASVFLLSLLIAPLAVCAEGYSTAPLVVIGEGTPTVTAAVAATNGTLPAPAAPAAPAASAAPVAAAPAPAAPATVPASTILDNFPKNAVTRVGENTSGEYNDAPASPANGPTPPSPAPAAAPANPPAPVPPANPVSKLWPRDTIQIFMPACVGFHPVQLAQPCACVITKLMVAMPHDEFLAKSDNGTIESDQRLTNIRQECATAPVRKD